MEFYEVLGRRHSVRKFLEKPVEDRILMRILQAGMSAPSAANLQSYKIYIVRSQEAKEAIVPAADYQEFLAAAPILLVFFADQKRAEAKFAARGFELYSVQDATIAASYCQLAAAAEGLGSVWVGDFDPLELSRVLSARGYEVPVAILALGYPGGEVESSSRRQPKEIVREV